MKIMRIITVLPIVVTLVASVCSCESKHMKDSSAGEHEDVVVNENTDDSIAQDNDTSHDVPPYIPPFVKNLMEHAEWWADTICAVNGKAYCYASEDYGRMGIVFDDKEILVADPTLRVKPVKTGNKEKFYVRVADKCLLIDFADKQSLQSLSSLSPQLPSFTRYKKDSLAGFGRDVFYSFQADFPHQSVHHAHAIRKWLVDKIADSQSMSEEIPSMNALDTAHDTKHPDEGRKYRGNIYNHEQIAKFVSSLYFAIKKGEYGNIDENYPCYLFSILNLRARVLNNRFVTYIEYTHDYNAGIHGYYTEKFRSFDHVHQQEIDFNYLFCPQYKPQVLETLLDAANNHPWYEERGLQIQASVCPIDENGKPTGEFRFPHVGLTETGVVFSFQPYDIGSFSEGTFHYVVPYKKLKPYMTERGKWCVGV